MHKMWGWGVERCWWWVLCLLSLTNWCTGGEITLWPSWPASDHIWGMGCVQRKLWMLGDAEGCKAGRCPIVTHASDAPNVPLAPFPGPKSRMNSCVLSSAASRTISVKEMWNLDVGIVITGSNGWCVNTFPSPLPCSATILCSHVSATNCIHALHKHK